MDKKRNPLNEKIQTTQNSWLKKLEDISGKTVELNSKGRFAENNLDFVFIFDSTASMSPYIDDVKKNLKEIIQEIMQAISNCMLSIIVYNDYGYHSQYVTRKLDFCKNEDHLIKFINDIYTTDGNDIPEALEVALSESTKLQWRPISKKAILVVGDAPPHGVIDEIRYGIDYKKEVFKLKSQDIKIYAVQCGHDLKTREVFEWIANTTNGKYLNLVNIEDLKNILIGTSMKEAGLLDGYIKKLNENKSLTDSKNKILLQLKG